MTASIAQTVRSHFDTEFPLVRPTVPIAYDGYEFDPEVDARDASDNPVPWVRVTIFPVDRNIVEVGGTTRRNTGFVWIEVYTPMGDGPGLAEQIAADIAPIFEAKTISGVTFRAAPPKRVGQQGSWYRWDVQPEYVSDEVFT